MGTEAETAHPSYPGWRSWLVAALLALCYTFSYLDRQVMSLLIAPIKQDLGFSDTQIGLMQGVSFSLFYVAASLPLAWLADRSRRSRLISGCVAFWSLMTMACASVSGFWSMLAARIGVAAGESGLPPAALATLADRFDPRRLATATSMFMLAPFVGGGLALAGGGALYKAVGAWERSGVPVLGDMADWRLVFLLVGAPGLVLAALVLLIQDSRSIIPKESGRGFGVLFAFMRTHWRVALIYPIAMGMMMTLLSSYVTWLPAAIMRSHGIDEPTVGALFGPIYLIAGATGTMSAGVLIMTRGGDDPFRTVVRYMLLLAALLWPVAMAGPLVESLTLELILLGVGLFLISSITGISSLPFQYITPRPLRAQGIAVLGMLSAMFGTGLGPILAGVLSDGIGFAEHPLAMALTLIGAGTVPAFAGLLLFALKHHARTRLDLAVTAAD